VAQPTRAKQKAFLDALALLGTIDHTAKAARMSDQLTIDGWKKTSVRQPANVL